MTGTDDFEDSELEALFAEASAPAPLSDSLTNRILADATAVQAARTADRPHETRVSVAERLLRTVGGWGGVGGLAMATVAGLWIGFSNPTLVAPQSVGSEMAEIGDDALFGDILLGDNLFFEEG